MLQIAVERFADRQGNCIDRHAAFSRILEPVVKFNEVTRLLCFYYNGAFIHCDAEDLEIPNLAVHLWTSQPVFSVLW